MYATGTQGLALVHFSAQPKPFWSHLPVSPCQIDWGKFRQVTYPAKCAHVEPEKWTSVSPCRHSVGVVQEVRAAGVVQRLVVVLSQDAHTRIFEGEGGGEGLQLGVVEAVGLLHGVPHGEAVAVGLHLGLNRLSLPQGSRE